MFAPSTPEQRALARALDFPGNLPNECTTRVPVKKGRRSEMN
jgi:hypothetical protein